jgi:hypothetical protein
MPAKTSAGSVALMRRCARWAVWGGVALAVVACGGSDDSQVSAEVASSTMTLALAVLWLSGGALVALAWQHNPDAVLNEKLWVKVITVLLLLIKLSKKQVVTFTSQLSTAVTSMRPRMRLSTL